MSVIWYDEDSDKGVRTLCRREVTQFAWASAISEQHVIERAQPEPVLNPFAARRNPSPQAEAVLICPGTPEPAAAPEPEPVWKRWPWDYPWDAVFCGASLMLGGALSFIWAWIALVM